MARKNQEVAQEVAQETTQQETTQQETTTSTAPVNAVNDDGTYTILVPSADIDENKTVSAFLKTRKIGIPRTIKEGQEKAFCDAIQMQFLCRLEKDCEDKIGKENKKRSEQTNKLTEKDADKEKVNKAIAEIDFEIEKLNKKLELARFTADRLGLRKSDDAFANIIAQVMLNIGASGDNFTNFAKCLFELSEILDKKLEELLGGKTVNLSSDEQEKVTEVKSAFKKIFEITSAETQYNNAFKLSIGNKEVIDFYKNSEGEYSQKAYKKADLKKISGKVSLKVFHVYLCKVGVRSKEEK